MDVLGIINIADIADVVDIGMDIADISTDIADIATGITDVVDSADIADRMLRTLRWKQVDAYKVSQGCPVIWHYKLQYQPRDPYLDIYNYYTRQ